jgi:hemoglobin-like flavoprotein
MTPSDLVDPGPKDIFLQSLKRCDLRGDFLEQFYERFIASSPDVRDKFVHTDLYRQRRMLRRSLELMARATAGDPEGLRELHDRAETHRRSKLDIAPPLYDLWLDALVSTAGESDPEWTPAIEDAWREILGIAIRHMTRRYRD